MRHSEERSVIHKFLTSPSAADGSLQEEEAKQLKKEQKKALKAGTNGNNDEDEETNAFDGITSIGTISKPDADAGKYSAKGKGKGPALEDEEDVPILINSEYQDMKTVLDKADVVLHVLDARDPLAYVSTHIQEYVKTSGKGKTFLVMNKIGAPNNFPSARDMVPNCWIKMPVRENLSKHGLRSYGRNIQLSYSAQRLHSSPEMRSRAKVLRRKRTKSSRPQTRRV